MATTNVYDNDANLVFLYRYDTIDTDDGSMTNDTLAASYTGLNTMSISGTNYQKVLGPSGATVGSGVEITGFSTLFHLPASNQSGNASGVNVMTTSQFTFGGWFKMNNNWTNQRAMLSNFAFGNSMRRYQIEASSGASKYEWRVRGGADAGATTVTVTDAGSIQAGEWMHVVGSIDGSVATDNFKIYVSGILTSSGSETFDPDDAESGNHPGVRLGAGWSATSETIVNAISTSSGAMAETFFANRLLTNEEISGIYVNGFQSSDTGVSSSDTNDSLKDNVGTISPNVPTLSVNAWDGTETSNPSGSRHIASGLHPAFIKVAGEGSTSGISFEQVVVGTPSNPIVVTFRNTTSGTLVNNMKIWLTDISAFAGVSGWNVAQHIDSVWLPNLVLPSGSGTVGQTLAAASSILRSDTGANVSGEVVNTTDLSYEPDISQYIYLSFATDSNFTKGNYGPTGFRFRITADYQDA